MGDAPRPASRAEVVVAMHEVFCNAHRATNLRAVLERTLTAALSLGCLLPEEADELRAERDAAMQDADAVFARGLAVQQHRDALATRLRVAEEALRVSKMGRLNMCKVLNALFDENRALANLSGVQPGAGAAEVLFGALAQPEPRA